MNLVVERGPALSALSRITGVVERKHTIPILSNVLLKAEGGSLTMRATDLEMEVMESFLAQVEDFGEISVPADKLHDIVRNADVGAQIDIKQNDEGTRVAVKSGRSRFNLPALPAAGFPKFEAGDLDGGFRMPAKLLADMLSRVVWGAKPAPDTSALSGVYFATIGDELHAVTCCTDGIALRREPKPEGAEISAILPVKFVNAVTKWLAAAEGDCRVACSGPLIRVEHCGSILTSKLFDYPKYAPYESALIESHEVHAMTDQDALGLALRRVSIMNDGKANSARLTFSEGSLSLQARSDLAGEGVDEIAADYEGADHNFLLSCSKMANLLGALRGDRIEFGFGVSGEGPNAHRVVIRAPIDRGFTAIATSPRA